MKKLISLLIAVMLLFTSCDWFFIITNNCSLSNIVQTEDDKPGTVSLVYSLSCSEVNTELYTYMYAFYYNEGSATAVKKKDESYDVFALNTYPNKPDYYSGQILSLDVDDFDLTPVDKDEPVLYVQLKVSTISSKTPINISYRVKSSYYSIKLDAYSRSLEDNSTPDFSVNLVINPKLIAQLDAAIEQVEADSVVEIE